MKATPSLRAPGLSGALEKVLRRVIRDQKLARDLEIDPIHDLRVALRRCRSLAEGFAEMDPRPVWRDLRKACAKQQSGLSELRDSQVLAEWVERLGLSQGPDGKVLVAALEKAERRGRREARASLESFSRKEWKGWWQALPEVARSLPVGRSRLARIAFDRATEVCLLERRWRRTRSAAAWHRLRVAVKRLRYAVERFLPAQHAAWGGELKRLQDLLGEGHDLDVLRAKILKVTQKKGLSQTTRERWLATVAREREQKTEGYLRASAIAGHRRGKAFRHGAKSKTPKETYVYDSWRAELARLARVNLEDAAKPTRSAAIRG